MSFLVKEKIYLHLLMSLIFLFFFTTFHPSLKDNLILIYGEKYIFNLLFYGMNYINFSKKSENTRNKIKEKSELFAKKFYYL